MSDSVPVEIPQDITPDSSNDSVVEVTPVTPSGFAALGLDSRLLATLNTLGYTIPTPIQAESIPVVLSGRDLVGQASTGTGKTAAFALPILHRIVTGGNSRRPSAIVLVPTRELAMQVAEAIHKYGKSVGLSAMAVYGGQSFGDQVRGMRRGVDVVVATPGRILDHIRRETLPKQGISTVVLDEADEMLDMGFAEDIEAILSALPSERQTMLFSATMPPRIAFIADKHLTNPVRISVSAPVRAAGEAPRVRQVAYVVPRGFKPQTLARVLDMEAPTAAIIFCRTRTETDELTHMLIERGYKAAALHGGMTQDQRDRVMRNFRDESLNLLIATDVAARGLDITHLSHVINFHMPESSESYVHRIGRVGRAGREGVAIILAEPNEQHALRSIERVTRQALEMTPIPNVAQLRARRLERSRDSVREMLLGGEFDDLRPMLEDLMSEYPAEDVAMAAMKLISQSGRADEEEVEIPDIQAPKRTQTQQSPYREQFRSSGRFGSGGGGGGRVPTANDRRQGSRPGRGVAMARLSFSVGHMAGITPRDLVGAIANEVGLTSKDIGDIDIQDRFSTVDVVAEMADDVVDVMQDCRIRGRKVQVRRERTPTPGAPGTAPRAPGMAGPPAGPGGPMVPPVQ